MTDDEALVQALRKDQTNYDAGAAQEVINRNTKTFQKIQTGTVTDRDRQNIINAIIRMQKEEGNI